MDGYLPSAPAKDEIFEDYLNDHFTPDPLFSNEILLNDGADALQAFNNSFHLAESFPSSPESGRSPSSNTGSASFDPEPGEPADSIGFFSKFASANMSNAIDGREQTNVKTETGVMQRKGRMDTAPVKADPTTNAVLTVSPEDVMMCSKDDLDRRPSASSTSASSFTEGQPLGPKFQLNLLGIPAKSRVETQLRLGIQIVHAVPESGTIQEMPIGDRFQWLKLPSWGMAKEKLKMKNRRDAPKTIDPAKIVFLEARVVKSTEPFEDVKICAGCIMRERKRAQRKKKTQKKSRSSEDGSDSPAQDTEIMPLPDEDRKILVFNCPELMEISNGEVTIPTRVTCYCRHHREKNGFRQVSNFLWLPN